MDVAKDQTTIVNQKIMKRVNQMMNQKRMKKTQIWPMENNYWINERKIIWYKKSKKYYLGRRRSSKKVENLWYGGLEELADNKHLKAYNRKNLFVETT